MILEGFWERCLIFGMIILSNDSRKLIEKHQKSFLIYTVKHFMYLFNEKSLNIIAGNSGTELFSQIISGNFSTLYNLYEPERGSDIHDIQQVNDKSVFEVSMNLVTRRFTEDL